MRKMVSGAMARAGLAVEGAGRLEIRHLAVADDEGDRAGHLLRVHRVLHRAGEPGEPLAGEAHRLRRRGFRQCLRVQRSGGECEHDERDGRADGETHHDDNSRRSAMKYSGRFIDSTKLLVR
jgi:hypothetical protein